MLLYGCVFSAYICWIELNPHYLSDSRVLWKIQVITIHCKQSMFLLEFWNGRGTICPNVEQSDFQKIKAKIIEISMYLPVVFGLLVCLFVLKNTALFLSSCWSTRQQSGFASSLFPCDRTTKYGHLLNTVSSWIICSKQSKIIDWSGTIHSWKGLKDRIWWFNFSAGIFYFNDVASLHDDWYYHDVVVFPR